MGDSRVLRAALAYAGFGWATFPVYGAIDGRCTCTLGASCDSIAKHPPMRRWGKVATTVEATLRKLFLRHAAIATNLGIATGGPSGLWALDVDPRHGGEESLVQLVEEFGPLPPTVEAITGSRGRHIFFQLPNGSGPRIGCPVGVRPGLDVRGEGGFVVAPPSTHANGRLYEWEASSRPGEVQVAAAPEWLIRLVGAPASAAEGKAPAAPLPETLTEGRRHEWLLSFAGTMRHRGAEPPEIEAALATMNRNRCAPPVPDAEVAAIARSMAAYAPATVAGPRVADAGAPSARPAASLSTTATANGTRPRVVVNGRSLSAVITDAWRAVVAHEARTGSPGVFVRDRDLVRIIQPAGDRPRRIDAFGPEAWSHALSVVASFCRTRQKEATGETIYSECFPPLDATRAMLASPTKHLPPLEAIISTPRFAADGTLLGATGEGYYAANATYFAGTWPPDAFPPAAPTMQDVIAARALILDELLVDFPFEGPAERAHAVAALILPFVRPMVAGPTPLHFFEAPVPSTGKGLLAAVIGIVTTGSPVMATPLPETNDEIRKTITSALLSGAEFIFFDNVTEWKDLNSSALACALTSTLWSDRQLQVSKTLVLRNGAVWFASGNNVSASGEIGRRCVRIRMDPHVERPSARTGFHHPLPEWASANRYALARACLTLVAAWLAEGRPVPASRPLASFESWSTVLGGILLAAGIPGFLANREESAAAMDADSEDWAILIDAWNIRYGTAEIHADDIARLVLEAQVMRRISRITSDHGRATAVGQAVRAIRGRVISGHTITWRRDCVEGRVFRLERAALEQGALEAPAEETIDSIE